MKKCTLCFLFVASMFVTRSQVIRDHRTTGPDKKPTTEPVRPVTSDGSDISRAPLATQAEIDEFNFVVSHQMGVGVLGGETTKPFYFHHNQTNEMVYKYKKVIDGAKIPSALLEEANKKLGRAGIVLKPFQVGVDALADAYEYFFGSGPTQTQIDCWFPVSENKKTVCGKMKEDAFYCPQDYLHTEVTIDKDICLELVPSDQFQSVLSNRWTKETHDHIEGEIKLANLGNALTTLNPLLIQTKKDVNVCFYGPWMGDLLQFDLVLGTYVHRTNNEIHPINQFWSKNGTEVNLIAAADGTGYFQKTGNGEIEASGLNQRMRFYYAFIIPDKPGAMGPAVREYHVNGVGFEFTDQSSQDVQQELLTLKNNGVVRIKVNDNSFVRNQLTHRVFFDKVRKRANGYTQGYIVIETEPIRKKGGSINLFIKDVTVNNSPVNPDRPPVRVQ